MIKAGVGNQIYVPVLSGLNAGEIVVTDGAYLLNIQAVFKNESDNMAGMNMLFTIHRSAVVQLSCAIQRPAITGTGC
ncbi:hypothetical protein CKK33_18185 [Mucilaginibacter sp. MD40]|uniref:hypothetical protein n=1 Tax=Mucilaginibacter sp. MD40 TaxID=2029590 RepID=UPI000BAC6FF7|nr:hypothetical protein [Mucilaginibacter sp. MD40]PAW95326.1 hypothetical protein CKK33_18185 [Mucilaginibacter sp. MD40]